jgi:DNA-binding transcriptional ArsR family regulator
LIFNDLEETICKVHADFCSVFASPTRIKLFRVLQEREYTVSELSELLDLSLQNVSQHLRLMRDKGAVTRRKEANKVFYQVVNEKFITGCRLIREGVIEEMNRRASAVNSAKA